MSNSATIPDMEAAWEKASTIGRGYLWSILLWGWFAPIMAGQETVRLRSDGVNVAYWQMLLIAGAWCVTAATLAPPIFYIVRRYPISRPLQFKRVAGYFLGAIPYLILSVCIRSLVLPPWDPATGQFMNRSFDSFVGNAHLFALQTWDYTVVVVASHAYEYFTRARNQELERARLQQALAESELQALKSQLQPHFLFNTLHGISTLIEMDKSLAKEMVLKLSSLLRTVLQDGTADLIPLEEEWKFAETYLDIEKMRLGERLEIRWKVQPGMQQLLVPALILQPLVENAILHGAACSRDGGWVEIDPARGKRNRIARAKQRARQGDDGLGAGIAEHPGAIELSVCGRGELDVWDWRRRNRHRNCAATGARNAAGVGAGNVGSAGQERVTKMRVLIVDDEPLARNALERVLRTRGDVESMDSAADAFQALSLLQEKAYDVLLLDIRMPELSGIELVDRLKKRKTAAPSIVFVTAHNQHAVAAFEKHAVDYVLKPFSDERIHSALDTAVHRSQSERAARFVELLPQLESLVAKSSRIAIKTKKSILFIDPTDLAVVEAQGN
jgi:two-component system, LytTR family, sensor kinase